MRLLQLFLILSVIVLQGCVIPAAIDAAKRWDHHYLIEAQQIGPNEFRAVIAIEHSRGEFDPIDNHGNHIVIRYVDLQLWHLTATETNIVTKREASLVLTDQLELQTWERDIRDILDVDFRQGTLALLPNKYDRYSGYVRAGNFGVSLRNSKVESLPNKGNCSTPFPPGIPGNYDSHGLLASDDGNYLLIFDISEKNRKASIFAPCNNSFSKLDISYTTDSLFGFSVDADKKSVTLRERSYSTHQPHNNLYRVSQYPQRNQIDYTGEEVDGKDLAWQRPDDFIYDEQSKRFYWIIAPLHSDNSTFKFVTYDPMKGAKSQEFIFK